MIKPSYRAPLVGSDLLIAGAIILLSLVWPNNIPLDVMGKIAFVYLIGSLLMYKYFALKHKYEHPGK